MTDRVPGAPGRYSAVVAGEELQKLQNAQPFAITLTRDDQPIKEGTPYNKATVLPDALAAKICPGITDPAPKDAFAALWEQKADGLRHKTGTAIAISDGAYTPMKGLRLFGKTIQRGTPTPDAPVEMESVGDSSSIDVTVSGKNLLTFPYAESNVTRDGIAFTVGEDGGITMNGTSTAGANIYVCKSAPSWLVSGKSYVLSGHVKEKGVRVLIMYKNENGVAQYKESFTWQDNYTFVQIYVQVSVGNSVNNLTIYPQVEMGTEVTAYEPHKEQQTFTVPTPNGLAGIPVPSGDNYTDENGQQWICDEIDFVKGVYIKRIQQATYNGTEAWFFVGDESNNYSNYRPLLNVAELAKDYSYPVICSHFKYDPLVRVNSGGVIGCYANNGVIGIRPGFTDMTTISQWKEWLAQNNLTILYAMETPIEMPLSAEQLAAYAKLHTNKPITTIYNDANADMEVTYYTPSTAVQMVHSPADEGKILAIDKHGCVVLADSALNVGSVKETFNALSCLDPYYDIDVYYTPYNPEIDGLETVELKGCRNHYLQVCEGHNDHLFGKTLRIKTYAYGNMAYGEDPIGMRAINPDADIVNNPESGVCEVTITIPPFAAPEGVNMEDWCTDHYFNIPFCENPYTELEMYVEHDTVWDSIKKLESRTTLIDSGFSNGWHYKIWSDGFGEATRHFYPKDELEQIDSGTSTYWSGYVLFPIRLWRDTWIDINVFGMRPIWQEVQGEGVFLEMEDAYAVKLHDYHGSITIYGQWRDAYLNFYVGDNTYTADFNMTWAEWCDSSYNTAGFKHDVASGRILSADNRIVLNSELEDLPPVKATDIIRQDNRFQLEDN